MLQAYSTTRALRPMHSINAMVRSAALRLWGLLVCAFFLTSCAPAEPLPAAFFSAPGGMALAGRAFDRLFVANTGKDTLQMVQLAPKMMQVDTVAGAARYFPLNIPVGPSPSEIAATADGRYVLSLDSINDAVQLIDATNMARVRDAAGQVVSLALGSPGNDPTTMLGAQQACTPSEKAPASDCLGRAYVAMRALGAIAVVDVRQSHSDQSVFLQIDRMAVVGGSPMRLATDLNETALFITDAQAPELVRLSLVAQNASVQRFDLGAIGGPVAVSQDGTFVVVGRPAEQDLLAFVSDAGQVGQGTLHILPANAVWTPAPTCLQLCNQPEISACQGAHEADQGLCVAQGGLAAEPNHTYAGLYIGGIPAQLAGLGADARGRLVTASCESPTRGREARGFQQAMAVAQLDGTLRLVGLRDAEGAPNIALLDAGYCRSPSLSRFVNQTMPLADVLAACPSFDANSNRFFCIGEGQEQGVVTALRGQANGQAWGVVWEGPVMGGESSRAGIIDAEGQLVVPTAQLSQMQIVPQAAARFGQAAQGGDILQVLTPPSAHDAVCQEALVHGTQSCQFERRITALEADPVTKQTTLRLSAPLPKACFPSQTNVRILAGDAFVVVPVDQTGAAGAGVMRLSPGDSFGPGLVANQTPNFSFTIRHDLDAAAQAPSCSRYDRSQPGPHPSAALGRGQLVAWAVDDPFEPQPVAERLDALARPQGPMGRIPQAMVATRNTARQSINPKVVDYLCVSYGGSNGVLILDPYDAPSPENRNTTSRLLQ